MKQAALDSLSLVHYCHPNSEPFQNIMRLPREEAFAAAAKMAADNPGAKAFGRFADFENYYPLRQKTDEFLYQSFLRAGGKPKEKHPLSFVLQGSDFLENWFGNGRIFTIPLQSICSDSVSFTVGDSCAQYQKTGSIQLLTKEQLLAGIAEFDWNVSEYMINTLSQYSYMEAQVWDDEAIAQISEKERRE